MISKAKIAARMRAAGASVGRRKAILARLDEERPADVLARLDELLAAPELRASSAFLDSPRAALRAARAVPIPDELAAADLFAFQPPPVCDAPRLDKPGRRRVACGSLDLAPRIQPAGRTTQTPAYAGAPTSVLIPGPRGLRALAARYILAPLSAVIASHDERFRPSSGYPKEMQERDYSRDEAEQAKIHAQALAWRPALVLNDDPSPASGPPIICARWLVVGGNSRTIALKMVAQQRPETYAAALRHAISAHAQSFGALPQSIPDLDRWGIFRLLEGDDYDPRSISRDLNQNWTQSKSQAAEAASCGAIIPAPLLRDLAALLAAPDMTLGEALARVDAVPALKKSGMITAQNQAEWLRYRGGSYNNALSIQGAQHLARCLVGAVVGSVEALSDASPSSWQLFERSAPALLAVADKLPESRPAIQRAASELVELEALPSGQRSARYRQGSLFGESAVADLSPLERALLSVLWRGRTAPAKAAAQLLEIFRAIPRPSPLTGEVATLDTLQDALTERAAAEVEPARLYALLDGLPMPAPVKAKTPPRKLFDDGPMAPAVPIQLLRAAYDDARRVSGSPWVYGPPVARFLRLDPAAWSAALTTLATEGQAQLTGTNLAAIKAPGDEAFAVTWQGEPTLLFRLLK